MEQCMAVGIAALQPRGVRGRHTDRVEQVGTRRHGSLSIVGLSFYPLELFIYIMSMALGAGFLMRDVELLQTR